MVLAVWKDPLYLAMAYIWDNIDICSLLFYYTAQIFFSLTWIYGSTRHFHAL